MTLDCRVMLQSSSPIEPNMLTFETMDLHGNCITFSIEDVSSIACN